MDLTSTSSGRVPLTPTRKPTWPPQDLAKDNAAMDMGLSYFDPKQDYFCLSCTYAKSHRNPFNKRNVERAKFPLEKVHTDMAGPLQVSTLSGCKYFLTFIDDFTGYTFIYIIKRK
ncbi:hypothetical protein PC128_g9037 [Phytophthora cactorum]|nr:hypothetical protein PC128_g9037 [Phytophthora cactorum]